MQLVEYSRYGDAEVLGLTTGQKPVPNDHEILIRVHATTVTSGDRLARSLEMPRGYGWLGRLVFGLRGPKQPILGSEFSGEVAAVGTQVRGFSEGDRVFAFPGARFGGYAEYALMSQYDALAHIPASLSFEQAAALSFGGCTALKFLCGIGQVQAGDEVAIIGASGGVGSACVQLASYLGAKVTAVCREEHFKKLVELGACDLLDSTQLKQRGMRKGRFDIVLDTSGSISYQQAEPWLNHGGQLLLVAADLVQALTMYLTPKRNGKKGRVGYASEHAEDLQTLARLASASTFMPWIERRYAFDEIAQAHRDYDESGKRGNWVVNVRPQTEHKNPDDRWVPNAI